MTIPGYDSDRIVESTLEPESGGDTARLSLIADDVPDAVTLIESDADAPPGALGDPVDLNAIDTVGGLDVLRLELPYDPSALPPGASPTNVAVAVATDDGYEPLESNTDLEETTVSATITGEPAGSTVVPITTYEREVPEDDSPRE
ncbi:hypothetical protein [Natronosalvus vescus]|uniref:hypothetical protein n=1 Tax=Natronosalvus vescus TaxID=2953881 RepID=UPI002090E6F1|nr:hypothetical protein [Natronosalvus vescus]